MLTPWRSDSRSGETDEADLAELKQLSQFIERTAGLGRTPHQRAQGTRPAPQPWLWQDDAVVESLLQDLLVSGTRVGPPKLQWGDTRSGNAVSVSHSTSIEELTETWWEGHEQRIAAIVADHWRGFARGRRAVRHRARVLLSVSLQRWKERVGDARRRMRSALIWDHRRLFLVYTSCFHGWVALSRQSAELRRKYVLLLHVRARSLYLTALSAWIQFAERKALRRDAVCRAEAAWLRGFTARSFTAWLEALQVPLASPRSGGSSSGCRDTACLRLNFVARRTALHPGRLPSPPPPPPPPRCIDVPCILCMCSCPQGPNPHKYLGQTLVSPAQGHRVHSLSLSLSLSVSLLTA